MAVLVNDRFEGSVASWRKDSEGRVLSLLLDLGNVRLNVINVYAPTNITERKSFFESLHEFFFPSDGLVLGGDFNCYDSPLDKFGGNVVIAKYLSDFKSTFNVVDVWRKLHPKAREMTWFNSDFSLGCRLDKFLLSAGRLACAKSCSISPCSFSDHDYVSLVLDFHGLNPRGPGLWKFNNSLLDDDDFCTFISSRMASLIECGPVFPSIKLWWDFFKESIKHECISFSKEKYRQISRERVIITNKLIQLKRDLALGFSVSVPTIVSLEGELYGLNNRALEGAKIRSRARWLEEGERPSRYFFRLERERLEKNSVNSIYKPDGSEAFSREEIEHAHEQFYANLFAPEPIDMDAQALLLSEVHASLSQPDRDFCEGEISVSELSKSLKSLNTGKAPGPDGLTVEFFVKFWSLLSSPLCQVIKQCFSDGALCSSMQSSVTRLIFKKRGDIKDLKNWRPISLLNVDYKICSKAITLRLSKVFDSIVDPDQTCSVPGRSIASNIVTLRDTLDYIDHTDESGILISLDQEKAFDRVDRDFLMALLGRFGFGPDFCRWIKTFYYNAHMQIILNGWLTNCIPLSRGVRQGDSLSPLLYVLCVEVLACAVRNCRQVRGFLLPGAGGKQFKVRQYADDTTSFIKDYGSLVKLFDLISVYERGSGAKLNRSKTEAMWLGAWRNRGDTPLGLTWVRKLKIVGVFFGTVPVEQDNWQSKINKLEKSLNLWKSRSLSFVGKCLIINILGLSKLFYLAKVLVLPKWVSSRVGQLIWPFLWGSKIETVSRNTCYLPGLSGGLGVVNLELKACALRIMSIVSTLGSSRDPSFFLCRYFLGSRLSSLRPEWSLLRDNLRPNASFLTRFYDRCFSDIGKITPLMRGDTALSTKSIYTYLLSIKSSPPLLPFRWSLYLGPEFSIEAHWANVRDSFSENFKNDLSWLITLRGVKVRDSLRSWGYIDSDRCAACNRKESIDHCFLNCGRVRRVWAFFAPLLSQLIGASFPINVLTVFFFRWSSNHRKKNQVARFFIKTVLYAIWHFRNKSTFHNGTEDHKAIIKYALIDFKNRVKFDLFRLPRRRFLDIWGFPCLLSVVIDKIVFKFP